MTSTATIPRVSRGCAHWSREGHIRFKVAKSQFVVCGHRIGRSRTRPPPGRGDKCLEARVECSGQARAPRNIEDPQMTTFTSYNWTTVAAPLLVNDAIQAGNQVEPAVASS